VTTPDVTVEFAGHVAMVEIHRPPNNFFDTALIKGIADAYERLDDDVECRAIVLCAEGKHFCADADFSQPVEDRLSPSELYAQAIRLFRTSKPVVAAVHGSAIVADSGLPLAQTSEWLHPPRNLRPTSADSGFIPASGLLPRCHVSLASKKHCAFLEKRPATWRRR
jgi:hypothetical protein